MSLFLFFYNNSRDFACSVLTMSEYIPAMSMIGRTWFCLLKHDHAQIFASHENAWSSMRKHNHAWPSMISHAHGWRIFRHDYAWSGLMIFSRKVHTKSIKRVNWIHIDSDSFNIKLIKYFKLRSQNNKIIRQCQLL